MRPQNWANQGRTEEAIPNHTKDQGRPGKTLHADLRGLTATGWYIYIITDRYSRYPTVQVVGTTTWEELEPGLEETIA